MKILLVDDDQDGLEDLDNLLRNNGFNTTTFADPRQALRAFLAGGYDVVLTDLKMPRLNGVELLKAVRVQDPEAYVIVITAFDDPENRKSALDGGAYDFFGKPLNTKRLLNVLAEISERLRLRPRPELHKPGPSILHRLGPPD
ncbi:response regulator [bacterium]|nr:response regulator [bacterium]